MTNIAKNIINRVNFLEYLDFHILKKSSKRKHRGKNLCDFELGKMHNSCIKCMTHKRKQLVTRISSKLKASAL